MNRGICTYSQDRRVSVYYGLISESVYCEGDQNRVSRATATDNLVEQNFQLQKDVVALNDQGNVSFEN